MGNSDLVLQCHLSIADQSMVHMPLVANQREEGDLLLHESPLWGTCQGTVWEISEGCVACGSQQPGRTADCCCLNQCDFLRNLKHIECSECLAMFSLVAFQHQQDIQYWCVVYHLHLDIPIKRTKNNNN